MRQYQRITSSVSSSSLRLVSCIWMWVGKQALRDLSRAVGTAGWLCRGIAPHSTAYGSINSASRVGPSAPIHHPHTYHMNFSCFGFIFFVFLRFLLECVRAAGVQAEVVSREQNTNESVSVCCIVFFAAVIPLPSLHPLTLGGQGGSKKRWFCRADGFMKRLPSVCIISTHT